MPFLDSIIIIMSYSTKKYIRIWISLLSLLLILFYLLQDIYLALKVMPNLFVGVQKCPFF